MEEFKKNEYDPALVELWLWHGTSNVYTECEHEDEHLTLLQLVAASSWSPSTSAAASVLQALEAKKDFIIYCNKYIRVIRSFTELPHRPAHAGSQLLQAQR